MASIRVKSEKTDEIQDEPITVLHFTKEEGWFVLKEIHIPKSILDKYGSVVSKTEPEIFPIFKDYLIQKARRIFGI